MERNNLLTCAVSTPGRWETETATASATCSFVIFRFSFWPPLVQLRIDALHRLCRKLARRRHLHLGFLFHGADSLHKGVLNGAYAILRFAKYKGPEIGHIEAHNERTKEKYASNPDVDMSRSHLNFHLVTPQRKYRAEAEKQIAEAGCRTRSDSVRVVEALVTASPEFFKGKKKGEIKAYFQEALDFMQKHQSKDTIISAVVHMDEKTPHMHLCFVPLTADGRLSAKEIVGNKKKLTQWQDRFWEHMVKKYPDLERGESASETGRDHIPPRLFKEAVHLNQMKEQIMAILNDTNPFNKKVKLDELEALLGKYVPGAEALRTKLKKYDAAYKTLTAENAALEKQLGAASKESVLKKLEISEKLRELDELHRMVDGIPPEILQAAKQVSAHKQQER